MEVDNALVVPVNRKVRIVLTADDVIHAFYVPALGVKQDAVPGFVRDAWFRADRPGTYRGACAELCGKDHAFMPIVVRVVSAEDYSKWVSGKKQQMAALADDPNTPDVDAAVAVIGDSRNDENLIVAQLHVAFAKFHNAVLAAVRAQPGAPSDPAAPIAASPATPAPATSTFAGGTLPAAVTCPVKNRPNSCAASITARPSRARTSRIVRLAAILLPLLTTPGSTASIEPA